jgi:hypothetical protein
MIYKPKENLIEEKKQTHPMGALSRRSKSIEHWSLESQLLL